ncbi:hypothetical protein AVEN_227725-1 [Araneus ventricosus]|uniref:Uncharacterized protein n=1 Tax=Araneus ventricosus TaxID=182803 RepID=A0A4Y2WG40_ARAVE|nr:hypothetical protein AVEN_227725-1 [Araneus ventricosus]
MFVLSLERDEGFIIVALRPWRPNEGSLLFNVWLSVGQVKENLRAISATSILSNILIPEILKADEISLSFVQSASWRAKTSRLLSAVAFIIIVIS